MSTTRRSGLFSWVLIALVAMSVPLFAAGALPAGGAMLFGLTPVASSPTYALENVVEIHEVPTGRFALWPQWSNDGQRISFSSHDPSLPEYQFGELHTVNVSEPFEWIRLVADSEKVSWNAVGGFAPDDQRIFFMAKDFTPPPDYGWATVLCRCSSTLPDVVERDLLSLTDVCETAASGFISHCHLAETALGTKLLLSMELRGEQSQDRLIAMYILDVDASGDPVPASAVEIFTPIANTAPGTPGGFGRPRLSPSANEIVVEWYYSSSNIDVTLLTGIRSILSGAESPVTSPSDPRVIPIESGANYALQPQWSEDGSLFFYTEDFSGLFDHERFNIQEADFDLLVVSLADAIAGEVNPYRILAPGTQAFVGASRGGTRIAYLGGEDLPNRVNVCTLRISDDMPLAPDGTSEGAFTLLDGSGLEWHCPAGTQLSGYGAPTASLSVSVFTPVSPVDEAQLLEGVSEIPVVRSFSVENASVPVDVSFVPPARLTLAYTDAEIAGLPEAGLGVYQYNAATGEFDTVLPVLERDPDNNRITVEVSSISSSGAVKDGETVGSLGLGGKLDTDGDGLSDELEAQLGTLPDVADSDGDGLSDFEEVYWDGDLAPDIFDSDINPGGTDLDPLNPDTDGDGVADGREAQWNSDPLDAASTAELPLAGIMGLALLLLALTRVGVRRLAG